MNIGDQYLRTLPPWIDDGRQVVVTVTRVLEGIEALNGHQVEGTWVDSQGGAHRGKFYLKDLTWCDSKGV